jgi:hypothetical protein
MTIQAKKRWLLRCLGQIEFVHDPVAEQLQWRTAQRQSWKNQEVTDVADIPGSVPQYRNQRSAGRLFCKVYGQKNVTLLNKSGKLAERLPLEGPCPTNLAFSREGEKILVTEVSKGQVEQLPAPCAGLELFYPKTT